MRYYFLFIAAALLTSCGNKNVEFKGNIKGTNYGKVIITNAEKEPVYKADVNDGSFAISKQPLGAEGFYNLSFLISGKASKKNEIYLEPGSSYTINADTIDIDAYPQIVSSSKKQTELSSYHDLLKSAKSDARKNVMAIDAEMRKLDDQVLTFEERGIRIQQLRNKQLDANVVNMPGIFNKLIAKYPDSEIIPHLMLATEYQLDPEGYYAAFKKLTDNAKSSENGKLLEAKLKQLSGLAAGVEAPPIEGITPDGKTIDIRALNKKVIIVDFWRALNSQSSGDHEKMANNLLAEYKDKGLEIVSVSFDDDREKWQSYIKKSNMTWPQLSDLKGEASPNAANWAITKIPTYYILDSQGRIVKRCLDYYELQTALNVYMAKH